MQFSNLQSRRPPGHVVVPPNAFADRYSERPTEDIAIGLRLIADKEITTARAQALRFAQQTHPQADVNDPKTMGPWIETYNDALMRWVVARGTCDPNDVNVSPSVWHAAPEDQVRIGLTDDGVRLIFDAWEKMKLELDPTRRRATSDDLAELPRLLAHLDKLQPAHRGRIERLLAFIVDELAKAGPAVETATTA